MSTLKKTPLTYYGGKQKLVSKILPLIPQHKLYVEPFIGGGAVFFSKDKSQIEVLNDTNKELMNFYAVLQNKFIELEKMVNVTLHSRSLHKDATTVYENPHLFDEVKRAWSVWVLSSQSFSAMLDGAWGYDKSENTTTKKVSNKRQQFTSDYAERLQNVQLESADALYVIKSRDTTDSFFYCDPPYIGSDMGHYDGYSEQDFNNLLKVLSKIKGRFILSSYPNHDLKTFTTRFKWHSKVFEQGVSVAAKSGYLKRKWEVLTANFPI